MALYTFEDIRHTFLLALYNILGDLENRTISDSDSEMEIMLQVWSRLVDSQYKSNKVFKCHRGEITSIASSIRRCKQSSEGERKKMGKRDDIVVRQDGIEYAYGEASLKSSDDDKKNQFDLKFKTMKSMKDILQQRLDYVDKTRNVTNSRIPAFQI